MVLGLIAAQSALLTYLSVARFRAFWTGRFDLGNMVQAVWGTVHGDPLTTTDIAGRQITRLGAHVDPVLVLLAPLFGVWPSPALLLTVQAVGVAIGALPAFWLARRWLRDDRLAVAAATVYLLYPPLNWATLTEFHPVTLAAPLLMFCIWAAEERRYVVLGVCGTLAALTKEQVGLALVMLAIWMAWRHRDRWRAAAVMAVLSATWVAVATMVIIPRFNRGEDSVFLARYGELGSGPREILATLLTRPWDAADQVVSYHRMTYLLSLLFPLIFLSFAAPLLAAGALPELLLNLLAEYWPQYSIEYQYVAVPSPFLIAAAILGLAKLRTMRRPRLLAQVLARPGPLAAAMVAVVIVGGMRLGPFPFWNDLPGASTSREGQYTVGPHAGVMQRAVGIVPDGARVSASNPFGAHLSERARIYTFPVVADAEYVVVDRTRPYVGFLVRPFEHRLAVLRLTADPEYETIFDVDGVMVFRHRAARG